MNRLLASVAIAFGVFGSVPGPSQGSEIEWVATFECLGLAWKPEGLHDQTCAVRYRVADEPERWRDGYPLWFDERDGEFRGSLVHLQPGTDYEIELRPGNSEAIGTARARTLSEEFPIAKTIVLPATSHQPLRITESGTADGYVLYTAAPGVEAVIDVANQHELCVHLDASHVILRGLTLKGAAQHGIRLFSKAHDIVIEDCEITGWGRIGPDGFGLNPDAAIFAGQKEGAEIRRLVIQRNRIHHPRADANSWEEYREHRQSFHPEGPHGIFLFNTAGNHVIRHNHIWSDDDHRFNDVIGGGENYSDRGSPNRDSDIYGNHLSHCWDDAIEAEGANRNVRIWGNYLDHSMVKIATASTSVGPLYLWRNVGAHTRKSDLKPWDESDRGGFLKTNDQVGGGRIFLFHNTILQPPPPTGSRHPLGSDPGLGHGGNMSHVTTRNNILHIATDRHSSILDRSSDPASDYDFDLYNGNLGNAREGSEANGIHGVPRYAFPNQFGNFSLDSDSPGFDAGVILPNFNDGFTGKAPDIGAQEADTPAMKFGPESAVPSE